MKIIYLHISDGEDQHKVSEYSGIPQCRRTNEKLNYMKPASTMMRELFVSILGYCCSQLPFRSERMSSKVVAGRELKIWYDTEFVSLSHCASLPLKTAQLKCSTKHKDYF